MDWLKARKKLLNMVKSQVASRLGPQPKSIRQYAALRDREFNKRWKSIDFNYFVRSLDQSDLVLLGDFHAYYQSQRSHIRVLKQLSLSQAAVFCEFLRERDQKHIDLFLSGKIKESDFLTRVQWVKNWEFPWEHYRPLLLFLKESGVRVYGLSGPKKLDHHLKRRDRFMAELIGRRMKTEAFKKAIVIVGEMHLADSHLPYEVRKRCPGQFQHQTSVFQDDDELYFKHAKHYSERESDSEGLILQKDNKFCWYVSPPWVKWQSYLMFLEQTNDRDLDGDGEDEDDLALEDHVKALALWIAKDFDIKISLNSIDVMTPNTLRAVKAQIPSRVLRILVQSDRSFLWDASGKIYLSRTSVNHGSALAGQYIHAQMSHRQKTWFAMPEDVFGRLWIESVGFFFSKWINPQRKTEDFEGLKIRLEALSAKKGWRDTLTLISEFYLFGQKVKRSGRCTEKEILKLRKMAREPYPSMECCRYFGRILGRNLFDGVRTQRISKEELLQWLNHPLEAQDFELFFWKVVVPRLI